MITLIRADGTEEVLPNCFKGDGEFRWMNSLLNIPAGYLEFVRILEPGSTLENPKSANLVVHESGLLHNLPFNEKASRLYWQVPIQRHKMTEEQCRELFPIVGDVLLLTNGDCVK